MNELYVKLFLIIVKNKQSQMYRFLVKNLILVLQK